MKKYKYRVDSMFLSPGDEKHLNALGREGWEIIEITPETDIDSIYHLIISKKRI